ncbi:unnamed protein product [Tilletia laevis]|uniref:ADF-H domain-containing protein n=1 Tax=Tilletia laevis TaxID=157183 RepID=A0A9N8QF58_9BASI|nr:unnamed protein product [Tilletia laevis]CAD6937496.1 unnamed protein product [Tilletia laevis]
MKSTVRALDIIQSLHKARPAAFEADLARTLDNHSMLSEAGQHEEALKAAEEILLRLGTHAVPYMSRVKTRMLIAASRNNLRNSLKGIQGDIQANELSENSR